MNELPDMKLRLGKSGRGGIGGGGKKNEGGYLKKHGKTKRGNEERVLKLMKELVIQEVSDCMGIPRKQLKKLDLDHISGRNAPGFAPLGSMLSPLNLQLLGRREHDTKTNALTLAGQRMDFRGTAVQALMVELNYRLVKKLGPVWDLLDLKRAIQTELYEAE